MIVFIVLCLPSFFLPELVEATRHRRQQTENVSASPWQGNDSDTSIGGNLLGASQDESTTQGAQAFGFNNSIKNFTDANGAGVNREEVGNSYVSTTDSDVVEDNGFSDSNTENPLSWLLGPPVTGNSNDATAVKESSSDSEFGFNLPLWGNVGSTATVNEDTKNLGNTSENGDSVPVIPLDLLPPHQPEDENADTNTKCSIDFCKIWHPCSSDQVCITTPPPQCRTQCRSNVTTSPEATESIAIGLPPDDTTTLRPWDVRTCNGSSSFECQHGVPQNCSDEISFSCVCDDGWSGDFCNQPCTLSCVHGLCHFLEIGEHMFCNCELGYIGERCDEAIPDPEEQSRILAAVLSSALAVVIILAVVIPIIMWRLRVILILRFVYFFKEYEDNDGKMFDAYVSMTPTTNAENFVYGSLRPMLESLNFKLYLQARDAPAGEVMSETILSAVEKSRRTIMIVTRDYITNEWNRFEYLIAQHETLKLQQRIIPVILEDIEKERVNMDKSLKHILDSIKCLKFPQSKPEIMTPVTSELSENIQSPDSSRSVNSTTHFYTDRTSSSTISVTKEEKKIEKKVAKFWKRMALSMPKKKTQSNQSSGIFSKFRKHANYMSTENDSVRCKNMEYNQPPISEFTFKRKVEYNISDGKKLYINMTDPYKCDQDNIGVGLYSCKTESPGCDRISVS